MLVGLTLAFMFLFQILPMVFRGWVTIKTFTSTNVILHF
jgi:hypothetical protein